MVAVRKVMERFFTDRDLKYLDDKMPDFHLRKKEDLRRKSHKEPVSIPTLKRYANFFIQKYV